MNKFSNPQDCVYNLLPLCLIVSIPDICPFYFDVD